MSHIVAAAFFTLALAGAIVVIQLTLREHWNAIVAALAGGTGPVRLSAPAPRVRTTERARPRVLQPMEQRRAA